MAGKASARQLVQMLRRPAEGVNAGAERHGAVDTAAGDHDIGAALERRGNRPGAEIGVYAGDPVRVGKGLAREHLDRAAFGDLPAPVGQVVAFDHGHFQAEAEFPNEGADRVAAGPRIDPARIGDDPDPAVGDLFQVGLEGGGYEVRRIARVRRFRPGPRQDRHGDLGQIVINDVIEVIGAEQLRGGQGRIAPEAARATNPECLRSHVETGPLLALRS